MLDWLGLTLDDVQEVLDGGFVQTEGLFEVLLSVFISCLAGEVDGFVAQDLGVTHFYKRIGVNI